MAGSCQLTVAVALPAVAVTDVGAGAGTGSMVIAVTEPSICSGSELAWVWVTGADPCEGR